MTVFIIASYLLGPEQRDHTFYWSDFVLMILFFPVCMYYDILRLNDLKIKIKPYLVVSVLSLLSYALVGITEAFFQGGKLDTVATFLYATVLFVQVVYAFIFLFKKSKS